LEWNTPGLDILILELVVSLIALAELLELEKKDLNIFYYGLEASTANH
tara:strand:- start:591 stop:734 length:144 start_codon:yes stop_codon:yes gene_type:complete